MCYPFKGRVTTDKVYRKYLTILPCAAAINLFPLFLAIIQINFFLQCTGALPGPPRGPGPYTQYRVYRPLHAPARPCMHALEHVHSMRTIIHARTYRNEIRFFSLFQHLQTKHKYKMRRTPNRWHPPSPYSPNRLYSTCAPASPTAGLALLAKFLYCSMKSWAPCRNPETPSRGPAAPIPRRRSPWHHHRRRRPCRSHPLSSLFR